MAFVYTTEYRLGRRGRIHRSYTGVQALIAIAFDLFLGFAFGVIGLAMCICLFTLATVYRIIFAIFTLPLRTVRAIFPQRPAPAVVKPAWASFREL